MERHSQVTTSDQLTYDVFNALQTIVSVQSRCQCDPHEAAQYIAEMVRGLSDDAGPLGVAIEHPVLAGCAVPCVMIYPQGHSEQAAPLAHCVYQSDTDTVKVVWS